MHNVKKNQIVVVLLVVMIVVAGYLNYRSDEGDQMALNGEDSVYSTQQFSQAVKDAEAEVAGEEANLADAEADVTAEGVLLPEGAEMEDQSAEGEQHAELTEMVETAEETGEQVTEEMDEAREPGEAIMVESDAVVPEYFAEAKVERENARAKSQDMLYDLMAKEETPDEEKSEAAQKILELQKRIENEAAAEAMIKAKGFDEAYVRIYDECVDVIVDRQEITQQEAAQIQDILTRITGLGADKIRISLLKIGA